MEVGHGNTSAQTKAGSFLHEDIMITLKAQEQRTYIVDQNDFHDLGKDKCSTSRCTRYLQMIKTEGIHRFPEGKITISKRSNFCQ